MTTSNIMINATKMLYATFFTVTLATTCSLQAMEPPHEGGGNEGKESKTSLTTQSKEIITLHCSDTTEFKVPYEIVIQCKTIKHMLHGLGYGKNTLDNISDTISIHASISSSTLSFIIKCLTKAQDLAIETKETKNLSQFDRASNLAQHCKGQSLETYIEYAVAANRLDCPLLLKTFCFLIEDMLNDHMHQQGLTGLGCKTSDSDVMFTIKLIHLIKHNKQLDPTQPITATVQDFVTCGLLDNDSTVNKKDLTSYIKDLIKTSQSHRLQQVLDALSLHATSLSIVAHEVLVNHIRTLTEEQIKELFETLKNHGESTLKMALRLVYAKDHRKSFDDLDGLDCVDFIQNINNGVNNYYAIDTLFFSQAYLQYVVPLIEPITKVLVTKLFLHKHNLTSLPDSIGNLSNLQDLNLANNYLTYVPASIGNLRNLTMLNLYNNKLTSLPASIGNLVKLDFFDLHENKLANLPDSIGNLVRLKHLQLATNQLTKLPDTIGNLVALNNLQLYANQLTELPDSIFKLVNLKMLNLSKNQLQDTIKNKLKKQFGSIQDFRT